MQIYCLPLIKRSSCTFLIILSYIIETVSVCQFLFLSKFLLAVGYKQYKLRAEDVKRDNKTKSRATTRNRNQGPNLFFVFGL